MKNIFYYISAAILVLCMAACSKETPTTPETDRQMTIVANIESGLSTKASLDGNDTEGYQVLWSEGDTIKFQVKTESEKKIITYTLSKGAGTTVGEFTGPKLPDGEYTAGYGDNLSMANGGNLLIEQSYSPSKNASCAPMMASVTVADGVASIAKFKNICGLLRLELKGSGTVKKIEVTTDQAQGGLFKLDEDGAARISVYPAPKYVTLDCGENGVELTPEAKPFYISMPKNDYTGVKIEVTDIDGNTITKTLKSGKNLSIARAQITPVSLTAVFKPISGTAKNSRGQEVPWVQLWDNGPKWAAYDIVDNEGETFFDSYDYIEGGDMAAITWGDNWCSPTDYDARGLNGNCDMKWDESTNSVVFTGKGIYSGNSISFTPGEYWLWDVIEVNLQLYMSVSKDWGVETSISAYDYIKRRIRPILK